jgi:hypothetical protein
MEVFQKGSISLLAVNREEILTAKVSLLDFFRDGKIAHFLRLNRKVFLVDFACFDHFEV